MIKEIYLLGTPLVALFVFGLWGCPKYNVYSSTMSGKAEFARAEQNRMILVEQARAEKDAALMQAEAIKVVGEMAQKFPEYRQQEFIRAFGEALKNGNIEKIIYVPTEANIPIIEARSVIKK